MNFEFENSYAQLPERFFSQVAPAPAAAPRLVRLNRQLAIFLNLDPDWLAGPDGLDVLSGRQIPTGAEPLAMAYAGHQFGQFVPQLGDGRAILLGEVVGRDGRRRDIQLKGAGRTPYSRSGDGRAALGPVLREYVISEAMAALDIPTTRALAAIMTGEPVVRERVLPGAILTRVASSHIRIGTFEFFAARGDVAAVRLLADYAIARHYPHAAEAANPYRALLDAVISAQGDLVARWLLVGFIHGVLNTDNISIAGETIDYGPCAFMDAYQPTTVFSSIDHAGRYAYGNQPRIMLWNLARLAETLLPLLDDDEKKAIQSAEDALANYWPRFEQLYLNGLRRKLGLFTERDEDDELVRHLLTLMAASETDLTVTFRQLGEAAADRQEEAQLGTAFTDPAAFAEWAERWRRRLDAEPQDPDARRAAMHKVNPLFIPRNHRVEAVIEAAVEREDFAPFEELMTVLSRPYDDRPELRRYANPPEREERVLQTFCGT